MGKLSCSLSFLFGQLEKKSTKRKANPFKMGSVNDFCSDFQLNELLAGPDVP
jgi:hypothetical protein